MCRFSLLQPLFKLPPNCYFFVQQFLSRLTLSCYFWVCLPESNCIPYITLHKGQWSNRFYCFQNFTFSIQSIESHHANFLSFHFHHVITRYPRCTVVLPLIKNLGSSSSWYLIWVFFSHLNSSMSSSFLPTTHQTDPDAIVHWTHFCTFFFFNLNTYSQWIHHFESLCLTPILPVFQDLFREVHVPSFPIHFGSYLYGPVGSYLFYLSWWTFRLLGVFTF